MTTNLDLPAGSELYQACSLKSTPDHSIRRNRGRHGVIHARGEDGSSKGRILVFQLDHGQRMITNGWSEIDTQRRERERDSISVCQCRVAWSRERIGESRR
ncbi:hypothetical protein BASA81_015622 [Batrachochytrium salamandrivorans]|nr:hypothetical protein BASA81_015622 [Batrachochytrium salamandrivorans]